MSYAHKDTPESFWERMRELHGDVGPPETKVQFSVRPGQVWSDGDAHWVLDSTNGTSVNLFRLVMHERTVDTVDLVKNFELIAEKWEKDA